MPINLVWEKGWIGGSGTLYNSGTTLRTTPIYYELDTMVSISIPNEYSLRIWQFNALPAGEPSYVGFTTLTSNGTFIFKSNMYYIAVFFYQDNNTSFDKTIISQVKIISHLSYYTKTNTEFILNNLENLQNGYLYKSLIWEKGWIGGPGTLFNNSYTLRTTPIYYESDTIANLIIPTGYSLRIWPYSSIPAEESSHLAGMTTFVSNGVFIFKGGVYYIIVLFYQDNNTSFDKTIISQVKIIAHLMREFSIKRLIGNWSINVIDQYKNKLDFIYESVLANVNPNTIVFCWMSDLHVGGSLSWVNIKNHPQVIDQIAKYVGADFVIDTGDIISNTNREDDIINFKSTWSQHYVSTLPVLYAKGNHEVWMLDDNNVDISNDILQGVTQKTVLYMNKSVNTLYYYTDIRDARIIVLDTSAYDGYKSGLGQKQLQFFSDALSTLGDKKAIIMCHIPLDSRANLTVALNEEADILQLLQLYKSKIVAVFHGHNHLDNIVTLDGITYIGICCSAMFKESPSKMTYGNPQSWNRTQYDITEFCIDTVVCDIQTKIIKTFRFGAGVDRVFTPES